eukprot:3897742-Pleurochrysis_carterae.AAC.1
MFSPPGPHGKRLSLPFGRAGALYVWRVLLRSDVSSPRPARAMAIHASRSRYHLAVMSPRDATICLHR